MAFVPETPQTMEIYNRFRLPSQLNFHRDLKVMTFDSSNIFTVTCTVTPQRVLWQYTCTYTFPTTNGERLFVCFDSLRPCQQIQSCLI